MSGPCRPKEYNALEMTALFLRDPTPNGRRLSHAVVLVPCCCRVNLETINKISATAKERFFVFDESANCPACHSNIIGYCEDFRTQDFVNKFFFQVGKQGKVLHIPEEPVMPWTGPMPEYPYPRENIQFNTTIRSDMIFFPEKDDAPIGQITVSLTTKEKAIMLCFDPEETKMADYLRAHGFQLKDFDRSHSRCVATEPEDIKKLWEIIVKNNEFPKECADQFERIIDDACQSHHRA